MPRPDHDFSAVLRPLVAVAVDQHSASSLLAALVDLASPLLGGPPEASVTVIGDGPARTVATSSDLAVRLDEVQYRGDDGPCLAAARERRPVHVLAHDEARWPAFVHALRDTGIDGVWSSPLPLAGPAAGSVNLYVRARGSEVAQDVAAALVEAAGLPVANAWLYEDAVRTAAHLRTALESRAVIEQAKGILMATLKVTADQAFDRLARASNDTNTKLRALAQAVVDTGQLPH